MVRPGAQHGPAGASLQPVLLASPRQQTVDGMSGKLKLVIVVGSVREGRFGPVVTSWVAGQAPAHGAFDVEVADLAD